MKSDRPYVCVVDAYSSGSLYAPALHERGFHSLHVQSQDPMPADDVRSFIAEDHASQIVFDGDFQRCARLVAEHRPVCIIAGAESGVALADRLSETLGRPTNGSALSSCRRDKFEMQRRIQDAGLRGIPSYRAQDWQSAEAWILAENRLPLVIKPAASSGTEQVVMCADLATAKEALDAIIRTINVFDEKNQAAVLQPLIKGDEYIVNTVSCAGHHAVLSVWKVEKLRTKHTLYDALSLELYEGTMQQAIREYTFAVLDALGIRYGAGHAELFWTADGPCLIEIAARLGGQRGATLAEAATGRNAVEASLDAYLLPERFLSRYTSPYQINQHACRVQLIAPRTGTLVGLPRIEDIRSLRSFRDLYMSVKIGGRVQGTIDFLTVPGYVDLLHADPDVIARDRAKIRELENTDFYQITE